MKLSTNSLSAKLYRWFYNQNKMPNNLCPYFWKLVIMYILIIPYFIITLPSQILYKFEKNDIQINLGYSLVLYFIIFLIVCIASVPILLLFDLNPNEFWKNIFGYGVLSWVVLIVFGIYHGFKYLLRYLKQNPNETQKENSNILVEFVKAKYNKYCPKINWDK